MFKKWLHKFFPSRSEFGIHGLVLMGVMLALTVVLDICTTLYISSSEKAISLSYLPGVVVAVLYGPAAALFYGFASDTAKFFINNHGFAYHPGYAISEALTLLFYSLLMFRRPVRPWKVILARVLFLVFVVFGLNYIWAIQLQGSTAAKYFQIERLVRNLTLFPLHAALTYIVLQYLEKTPQIRRIRALEDL